MPEPADKLTEAEVRTIARLAKLSPSDGEVESLRTELSDMLAMAAALTDADLEDVDPMTSPIEAITSGVGPMKAMPASTTARAKAAFSERKP